MYFCGTYNPREKPQCCKRSTKYKVAVVIISNHSYENVEAILRLCT